MPSRIDPLTQSVVLDILREDTNESIDTYSHRAFQVIPKLDSFDNINLIFLAIIKITRNEDLHVYIYFMDDV